MSSAAFRPDKFNVAVTSKWTSNSGRWIVFLGMHYDGKSSCWDCGQFSTITGECQRVHFPDNKPGAMIFYDELKKNLAKIKQGGERDERPQYRVLGPNGKSVS